MGDTNHPALVFSIRYVADSDVDTRMSVTRSLGRANTLGAGDTWLAPLGVALAPVLHQVSEMPTTKEKKPSSYDDIVRRTVVDPDSSVRPTKEQEKAAREGFRAMDDDEQALHDRVQQALAQAGAAGVAIEVARERVTLRGRVDDVTALRSIEDAVARVPGVDTVHSQLVVGAS